MALKNIRIPEIWPKTRLFQRHITDFELHKNEPNKFEVHKNELIKFENNEKELVEEIRPFFKS